MSLLKTIEHIITESNPLPITDYLINHRNARWKIATDQITINGIK